jgi:hypothetical protein
LEHNDGKCKGAEPLAACDLPIVHAFSVPLDQSLPVYQGVNFFQGFIFLAIQSLQSYNELA